MLKAFTDDSGSDPKSRTRGPAYVMAGYLSSTEIWEGASDRWQSVLDAPPKLDYFKSTGVQDRSKPPFQDWEQEDAELKAEQLSEVIQSTPLASFVLCVYWDDFNKAKEEFPNTVDIEPYGMLFNGVMASVTEFVLENCPSESVQFEFDEQGKAGEEALSIYREVKAMLPRPNADLIIDSPGFGDDTKILPLQMADMLAWSIRRYVAGNNGRLPKIENGVACLETPSRVLYRILEKKKTLWRAYDYPALRKMFMQWELFRSGRLSPEAIRNWLETKGR